MTTTQETLAVGVGMFTEEQAASQLPFGDVRNAMLLTKRLVARGSLPSAQLGDFVRIPIAGLTEFMADNAQNSAKRKALGLPMETLLPLFRLEEGQRTWFGSIPGIDTMWWERSLQEAVTAFLPARVMMREPGLVSDDPSVLLVEPEGNGIQVITIDVAQTFDQARIQALKAVINSPVSGASPFGNMGEICLARRLQTVAWDATMALHHRPGVIHELGVAYFYGSEANYTAVVNSAVEAMRPTAVMTAQKSEGNIVVIARLNGGTMMEWAGSNPGRLVCLAF